MNDDDRQFQQHLLQGVARTFALTIPQLPSALRDVVANAYLLCRIADTIEDESAIPVDEKCVLVKLYLGALDNTVDPAVFAGRFRDLISAQRPVAEKKLIDDIPRVIAITHNFSDTQQAALRRCVGVMSRGMTYYQANASLGGLDNLRQLDNYCYHVAGVVGEMLTELLCEYSPGMAPQKQELMLLSVSFGQGLQMTNILKDIREDYARGVCWLPRDVFQQAGFDLDHYPERVASGKFVTGIQSLLGICHAHLRNASRYIELIPAHESGLRKFCFWAVGMALLTLGNINRNPAYKKSSQIKIGKLKLLMVIAVSGLVCRSNTLIRFVLKFWSKGLPPAVTVSTNTERRHVEEWFDRK